jgi:hypothetical protein
MDKLEICARSRQFRINPNPGGWGGGCIWLLKLLLHLNIFQIHLCLTKHIKSISWWVIYGKNGAFIDFYVNKYWKSPVYGAVFVYLGIKRVYLTWPHVNILLTAIWIRVKIFYVLWRKNSKINENIHGWAENSITFRWEEISLILRTCLLDPQVRITDLIYQNDESAQVVRCYMVRRGAPRLNPPPPIPRPTWILLNIYKLCPVLVFKTFFGMCIAWSQLRNWFF